MKTWSRIDLIGLFFLIFGIITFVFSNSDLLTSLMLLISAVVFLHSIYNAKYDSAKYLDILCHYQAVLSSSADGWIAWNINNEYVASSKVLRALFDIKQSENIYMTDILSALQSKDAENLSLHFNKLRKEGANFKLMVKTTAGERKIEICGARMIIGCVETISFWCADVTKSSTVTESMKEELHLIHQKVESMREILDTLPIPIWRRNKNLNIIYCNKTYSDYLESTVEKVLAANTPLIPGNLFGQGHSLAENAKKSNRPQSIAQFITINGARKRILLHECPVSKEAFVGYANDVTSEETLTASLDKVVTANCEMLEHLPIAIVIFGENARVTFFNSAYQRLMKLESGWLHSQPTYGEVLDELRNNRQLAEQADYQAYKKSQLTLFTSIQAPTHELIHLPNGKTLRLLVAPYQLGGLFFMYEDVTDSLVLQRKNNTLLAVQKETINNLYEGIMVYGSDNRLKIINNAMQKIWKLDKSLADLKGMHISEILTLIKDQLDYGTSWEEFREAALSNLTDRIVKTGKLTKKDGSIILFSYVPLPDGAHMHSLTDVTDTYMVERAVIEKNQALKIAQELRFEFVSGISIELKEPLNLLIGFSELLLHQYFGVLNEKQLEYCQCILEASNHLHRLITDLLEMVSIDIDSPSLDLSSFYIKDAVDEVVNSLEKRINEKNISIIKIYPEQNIEFNGDKIRIKQAIYNILTNAIQASSLQGKINIIITSDGDNLKIIIKDDVARFFHNKNDNVFKRSPKEMINFLNGESGVGLPLVRSLIEFHGGTLKINSTQEEGTCVICTLPVVPKVK
ncbi:MAG: PAS-domain containing protein [Holosporaceae bacterium]|jgi:nitrogen-specific signal transduction histidine kinase|nr:PAS-domain containing protein [Holosporaceae bacterium]